jgi:hypothetical protein
MLQSIEREAQEAVRRADQAAIVSTFRKYQALPVLPIPPDKLALQNEILSRLNELRTEVVPAIWWRDETVQRPALPPDHLLILTEASSLEDRAAPTQALLQTISYTGREYQGLVQAVPGKPGVVSFSFSALLTLDPLLAWLATEKLKTSDEKLAGQFTNWVLTATVPVVWTASGEE